MNDQNPLTSGLHADARKVVKKGMELAASAKTAREYASAMRPVLAVLRAMNKAGRVQNAVESLEQRRARLKEIRDELGIEAGGEMP